MRQAKLIELGDLPLYLERITGNPARWFRSAKTVSYSLSGQMHIGGSGTAIYYTSFCKALFVVKTTTSSKLWKGKFAR